MKYGLQFRLGKIWRISNIFYALQMTSLFMVCLFLILTTLHSGRLSFTLSFSDLKPVSVYDVASEAQFNLSNIEQDSDCVASFLARFEAYCNASSMKLDDSMLPEHQICPCIPSTLVGKHVPLSNLNDSLEDPTNVDPGGHWSPSCVARQRIAIIVPFRNRTNHLEIFLKVMHPFLQRQLIDYTIFIVEQAGGGIFNKGILMNAGFKESQTMSIQFDCFIFHDVDLLPEDDRNFYTCANSPRHLAAYVDKFGYNYFYYRMFGGATAFTKRQYVLSNGYPTEYYGWGGEDDDMLQRIEAANMTFIRFPKCINTYKMFKHDRDAGNPSNPNSHKGWIRFSASHYQKTGLRTVSYILLERNVLPLYTHILVSVPPPPTVPPPTVPPPTVPLSTAPSPTVPPTSSSLEVTRESTAATTVLPGSKTNIHDTGNRSRMNSSAEV